MSLAGRLSAFFLGALALVLAGTSVALYAITANYFVRRVDERLTAALDTLGSSSEVNPEGVEWEPNDRNLTLGQGSDEDEVRWTVHDSAGRQIAASPNLDGADLKDTGRWRMRSRRVVAPWFEDTPRSQWPALPKGFYEELLLTAAVSPIPGQKELARLANTLVAVSCVAWLLAAIAGRWLCRRALRPVRVMAAASAAMSAVNLDQRLTLPGTRDELDELGSSFNGLLGRLGEAFERQRRFTGDAAHQLSTPLTVLLGQLEVALRRERPAEEYRAAIVEAHAQALRLRRIVELLLFLARPDAEAAPPIKELLDLGAWLRQHVTQWAGHPRSADLKLSLWEKEPLQAFVASALLGQLVDNLLDNAFKYSSPGSPATVALESNSEDIVLHVRDVGVGIDGSELVHVFEPFYRSPEARRLGKPGVGLGLAVAKRIADAIGGTLTAESKPGIGSCFTLRLPRRRDLSHFPEPIEPTHESSPV